MRSTFGIPFSVVFTLIISLVLQTTDAKIKIMPLSDSITDWGCWRAYLWSALEKIPDHFSDHLEFVGSQVQLADCLGHYFTLHHEGHANMKTTEMVQFLPGWLQMNRPDIVMVHMGTNDVNEHWQDPAPIVAALDVMVEQIRAVNPFVVVLVAKIIPMVSEYYGTIPVYNERVEQWARSKWTQASPVVVVDLWTGYDAERDNKWEEGDGVHPGESGWRKIAAGWFRPLVEAVALVRQRGAE